MHRAKGDRLIRARVLPVCDNAPVSPRDGPKGLKVFLNSEECVPVLG